MSDPTPATDGGLRAAARLRQWNAGELDRSYETDQGLHCDRAVLADLYLAANPPDSEAAITEDWLLSIGFETHGTITYYKQSSGVGPIYELGICPQAGCDGCCIRQKGGGSVYSVDILMPATRGDVRRLCAALGITITEPSA